MPLAAALMAPSALRAVLEGLPDATVAADGEGRIVFANLLAEELFGWTREEFLGQPVAILWPELRRLKSTKECAIITDRQEAQR